MKATLVVLALIGAFVLGNADGERRAAREWRELAVHCVMTAQDSTAALVRCASDLRAKRRCVCFDEVVPSGVGASR